MFILIISPVARSASGDPYTCSIEYPSDSILRTRSKTSGVTMNSNSSVILSRNDEDECME